MSVDGSLEEIRPSAAAVRFGTSRQQEATKTMNGATTGTMAGAIPGPLREPLRYGVYTGIELELESPEAVPAAAQLGLEPPRFCGQCGRRMVVQVRPDGWDARCSRHGTLDSTELGER